MGGDPDDPANHVWSCDTGHYNIHRILGHLIDGTDPGRFGTEEEKALALRGYKAWLAAGKPGRPVYQAHEQ